MASHVTNSQSGDWPYDACRGAEARAEAAAEAKAAADAEALAIMQPGNIIALHNTDQNRFVRMNGHNGRMDASRPKAS